MARPRFKPTDEDSKLVEELAGDGVTHANIAILIQDGICENTLEKYFKRELRIGKARAHVKLASEIYNRAYSGKSDTILIFLAKTQLRWKEPREESEQKNVTITITGGLPE